jgi:hypothetical protein
LTGKISVNKLAFSNYWRSKDAKLQLVKLMTKVFLGGRKEWVLFLTNFSHIASKALKGPIRGSAACLVRKYGLEGDFPKAATNVIERASA